MGGGACLIRDAPSNKAGARVLLTLVQLERVIDGLYKGLTVVISEVCSLASTGYLLLLLKGVEPPVVITS